MFIMPIGLTNIGWKMYMVNASWDIVIVGLIVSSPIPLPHFRPLLFCLLMMPAGILLGGD